jgi:hypothetical protein
VDAGRWPIDDRALRHAAHTSGCALHTRPRAPPCPRLTSLTSSPPSVCRACHVRPVPPPYSYSGAARSDPHARPAKLRRAGGHADRARRPDHRRSCRRGRPSTGSRRRPLRRVAVVSRSRAGVARPAAQVLRVGAAKARQTGQAPTHDRHRRRRDSRRRSGSARSRLPRNGLDARRRQAAGHHHG